ncbi:MAG TPA: polysaccharide biosynthesis/export family protein [bacterium]|nr:polysaccharide biosynthesis/export family protein [bacterium]
MKYVLRLLRRNAVGGLVVLAMLLVAVGPAATAPVYMGPPAATPPTDQQPPSSGAQPAAPPAATGGPAPQAPSLAPSVGGAPQPGQTNQEYTVQPGDVLQISVVGEPEVSGLVTAGPDGSIMVPLVGRLPAMGATLPQLTDRVTQALKTYIRDPQVSITISQAATRQQYVYVLGQVSRPGAYQLQDGFTIAAAIAAAGGPTPSASLGNAFIMRKSQTIPVDLQSLLVDGNTQANTTVEPGDIIVVPEGRDRVLLMGAVARPGPYVINPGDRLVDLLSAAGGSTQDAKLTDVGVIRHAVQASTANTTAKPTVTEVDLTRFYKNGDTTQNIELQAGDIVYVPQQAQHVVWNAFLNTVGGLGWLVFFVH